jgi:Rrf2 family transcriptional regulator, nitric oxide-sensitive transcriptional repressor
MRLTLHTDYALRVLIHVAIADGPLITISDIAKSFDISKQHLMKVANNLSQKGYLDAVRGRGGGMRRVTRCDRRVPCGVGYVLARRSHQTEAGIVMIAVRL